MTAVAARLGGLRWTHPRTVGIVGIFLGIVGFWLALPPVASRSSAFPILLGVLAIAAGIWTWSRDQRLIGGGAVASGLLGIVFGLLANQSSTSHLNQVVVWSALLAATLRYATPLTFAAIGGLYCERSGVINVALEGMLLTGAFFGIWGAIWAHGWAGNAAWVIGLLTAALAGMAMATIHAVWAGFAGRMRRRSGSAASCSARLRSGSRCRRSPRAPRPCRSSSASSRSP
ncbi:MAG TPA: hypothetical protein VNR59_02820, partial [Gaiellaceae bacterium]|nr:hypothetical protein [Gaiellaceae bacterium]